MVGIASKHLFDVCLADECHSTADARCCELSFVNQFVNVLARASHEDGCLWKSEILLTCDVNGRLYCLDKVLLFLLALSLCRLGTMFWAILLRTAVASELLAAESTFSCLSHSIPNYVVLHSFRINHRAVNSCKPMTTLVNSFHDISFFKRDHFLSSFPLVFESTKVNVCKPLSTLSTR